MTTNSQAIASLVAAKSVLQSQCDAASGKTLTQLDAACDGLTSEIGALEAKALNDAAYIPATDAFNQVTQEGKDFLSNISNLKSDFAKIASVANALDTVIKLMAKVGF